MSYTSIYSFDKKGESHLEDEIHNSHRSAPCIWDILYKKYFPLKAKNQHIMMIDEKEFQSFFDLVYNKDVNLTDRIVLMTTADYALVKSKDFDRLLKAFYEFDIDHAGTSLYEQANIIHRIDNHQESIAVGWQQTSVSETLLEEYNCLKGKKHFWLFDELN